MQAQNGLQKYDTKYYTERVKHIKWFDWKEMYFEMNVLLIGDHE